LGISPKIIKKRNDTVKEIDERHYYKGKGY